MGKKKVMSLPTLFNNRDPSTASTKPNMSLWAWPSCKQPKTQSFREHGEDIFKTVNSVFCDSGDMNTITTPESWFTNSSESASFSTVSEESGTEFVESMIRGLRSDRLFFEPGDSNSILEESKSGQANGILFKESVVLALESEDPYVDFRTSMEEMVEAHGLKNWECLEELLCWYLRVNGKKNHGFIVGAFVDLLVGLAVSPKCGDADGSPSSSSSCSSSPSLSSLQSVDENQEGKISSLQI